MSLNALKNSLSGLLCEFIWYFWPVACFYEINIMFCSVLHKMYERTISQSEVKRQRVD